MDETKQDHLVWADRSDLLRQNPDDAFVYRIRNRDGVIIYIGMTVDTPERRLYSHRSGSSWWGEAVSAEICRVPALDVRDIEGAEIHRWHPVHNGNCRGCQKEKLRNHPLYPLWIRITRRTQHSSAVCEQWKDINVFIQDIEALRPKPDAERVYCLRLIDPQGIYEPSNVYWGSKGPY